MSKWDDVAEAISEERAAYDELLYFRSKHRSDSRKVWAAYDRWLATLERKEAALLAHWDEAEHGVYRDGSPRLTSVAHEYYRENVKPRKKRG